MASWCTFTSSVSRFAQQLVFDRDSEAVRIIKGRTSRYAMRTHPFYHSLRVELETYKLLDASLVREFANGELYQLYVLPHSGVIIAAELIAEKGFSLFALARSCVTSPQDANTTRIAVVARNPAPFLQFVQVADDTGVGLEARVMLRFRPRSVESRVHWYNDR